MNFGIVFLLGLLIVLNCISFLVKNMLLSDVIYFSRISLNKLPIVFLLYSYEAFYDNDCGVLIRLLMLILDIASIPASIVVCLIFLVLKLVEVICYKVER